MESYDASGSPSARAAELRASLGTRREAESLLAEASAARRAAAADADALMEEAQQLSGEVLAEARAAADRLLAEAGVRAEAVVAQAREEADAVAREARAAADAVRARAVSEVEEHRRRVRAEVTAQVTRELEERNRADLARQQDRQQAVVGDLEASVRILGVSLDSAAANVTEMLSALAELRTHADDSLATLATLAAPSAPSAAHAAPVAADPAPAAAAPAREAAQPRTGGADELFRSTAPRRRAVPEVPIPPDPASGPASDPASDPAPDPASSAPGSATDDPWDGQPPPRTATEAFLRSAHLDHGDPPLPPMDDSEVGNRYARDAMRASARSRTRQDSETLGVEPERAAPARPGPDERAQDRAEERAGERPGERTEEPAGKPLGWLFRSP